jgi:hypothetical protein
MNTIDTLKNLSLSQKEALISAAADNNAASGEEQAIDWTTAIRTSGGGVTATLKELRSNIVRNQSSS